MKSNDFNMLPVWGQYPPGTDNGMEIGEKMLWMKLKKMILSIKSKLLIKPLMSIYLKDGASAVLGMKLSKRKDLKPLSSLKVKDLIQIFIRLTMKKYILNFFILSLISIAFSASAQNCVLPGLYSGNTGQNMTVFSHLMLFQHYQHLLIRHILLLFPQMEC